MFYQEVMYQHDVREPRTELFPPDTIDRDMGGDVAVDPCMRFGSGPKRYAVEIYGCCQNHRPRIVYRLNLCGVFISARGSGPGHRATMVRVTSGQWSDSKKSAVHLGPRASFPVLSCTQSVLFLTTLTQRHSTTTAQEIISRKHPWRIAPTKIFPLNTRL